MIIRIMVWKVVVMSEVCQGCKLEMNYLLPIKTA